jgi:hypothetical protein
MVLETWTGTDPGMAKALFLRGREPNRRHIEGVARSRTSWAVYPPPTGHIDLPNWGMQRPPSIRPRTCPRVTNAWRLLRGEHGLARRHWVRRAARVDGAVRARPSIVLGRGAGWQKRPKYRLRRLALRQRTKRFSISFKQQYQPRQPGVLASRRRTLRERMVVCGTRGGWRRDETGVRVAGV